MACLESNLHIHLSLLQVLKRLEKHREKTHLHHAIDAVVVACTDNGMIHRITNYHRMKESNKYRKAPAFPQPWDNFRDDLFGHINTWPRPEKILQALNSNQPLPHYMMVSRMARHSVTGLAHKETIMMHGGVEENSGRTIGVKRVALQDIKFDKNGDFLMVNKDTDPATYEAIKTRFLQHNGNQKKAFAEPL
ncbi:hypothetical protein [Oceanobacillus oncorhynchi]|nr:hypothetical protein [Oceanobacillus oncorhynchi]